MVPPLNWGLQFEVKHYCINGSRRSGCSGGRRLVTVASVAAQGPMQRESLAIVCRHFSNTHRTFLLWSNNTGDVFIWDQRKATPVSTSPLLGAWAVPPSLPPAACPPAARAAPLASSTSARPCACRRSCGLRAIKLINKLNNSEMLVSGLISVAYIKGKSARTASSSWHLHLAIQLMCALCLLPES